MWGMKKIFRVLLTVVIALAVRGVMTQVGNKTTSKVNRVNQQKAAVLKREFTQLGERMGNDIGSFISEQRTDVDYGIDSLELKKEYVDKKLNETEKEFLQKIEKAKKELKVKGNFKDTEKEMKSTLENMRKVFYSQIYFLEGMKNCNEKYIDEGVKYIKSSNFKVKSDVIKNYADILKQGIRELKKEDMITEETLEKLLKYETAYIKEMERNFK